MTKKPEISVCMNLRENGKSCRGQGAQGVLQALRGEDAVQNGTVSVSQSVCMGYCGEGPNVKVVGGELYHGVTPGRAGALVVDALKVSSGIDNDDQ